MNAIELDFVLDDNLSASRAEILQQIEDAGLSATILTENGPAGGNPLLKLEGTREQIESYLRTQYLAHDVSDLDFYMSLVTIPTHAQ